MGPWFGPGYDGFLGIRALRRISPRLTRARQRWRRCAPNGSRRNCLPSSLILKLRLKRMEVPLCVVAKSQPLLIASLSQLFVASQRATLISSTLHALRRIVQSWSNTSNDSVHCRRSRDVTQLVSVVNYTRSECFDTV